MLTSVRHLENIVPVWYRWAINFVDLGNPACMGVASWKINLYFWSTIRAFWEIDLTLHLRSLSFFSGTFWIDLVDFGNVEFIIEKSWMDNIVHLRHR